MAALLGTTKQVISRYETKKRIPPALRGHGLRAEAGAALSPRFRRGADSAAGADARFRQAARPDSGQRGGLRRADLQPGRRTDYITVEDDLPCDFALIAEGDSMIGDRIHSGDVVFLRSQDHVQDGEIAAVALDNEVTLKHVRRLRGPDGNIAFTQLLPPTRPTPPLISAARGETRMVRILGKAVAVRFML